MLKQFVIFLSVLMSIPAFANFELVQACRNGNLKEVNRLIEKGVDVNFVSFGSTALHLAVQYGYLEIVKALLKAKADVNARETDRDGWTPLHYAVNHSHEWFREFFLGVTKELLGANADLMAKDNQGRTPIDVAKKAACDGLAYEMLVAARAKVEQSRVAK